MTTKRAIPAAILLLASAVCAQAAGPATEADFSAEGARRATPARAGATAAVQQLAEAFRQDTGTLPQGFPFDLDDVSQLQQLSLGFGFQVYDIDAGRLAGGDSLSASARATGTWRFAVSLAGRPVGLVTLVQQGERWEAVSFGGAGLVQEMDAVVRSQDGKATLRYLRLPQVTADFIEVGDAAGARFVPLRAARESLRLDAGAASLSEAQLAPELRTAVAHHIDR